MEWNSYNISILIVNIFIAVGTIGAVIVALFPRKVKESVSGTYWFYPNGETSFIRVCIENDGNNDIVLDENCTLLFMRNKTCEQSSEILGKKVIIPISTKRNLEFLVKDSQYIQLLYKLNNLLVYTYTSNNTIIKLIEGNCDIVESMTKPME